MYTLLKPLEVRHTLIKKGVKIFTPFDFVRIFNLSDSKAKYFLETETKENGLLLRLKQGLYCMRSDLPSNEEIANSLYRPSYISFEYALTRYGIIPEATYSITNATTKVSREFEVNDIAYSYLTIKKEAYIGFDLVKGEDKSYLIADPEKALADYLYFVSLGLKTLNDRLDLDGLNSVKIKSYATIFGRKRLDLLVSKLIS